MPKKHAPNFIHTKPSYVHPSLQSSRASSSADTPAGQSSVNQRIEQLRREQAPKASPERRAELTDLVTQRTVPPMLRRMLGMAEVDSPLPKPGTRLRDRRAEIRAGVRPPPGPAAPTSWLQQSQHAPKKSRKRYAAGGDSKFCALAQRHDEEYQRLPRKRSLAHQCLRTLALHWEELAGYEQHYLPTLPIHHKEALLSYLSRYGNKGCLDFKSFKILFQNDKEVEGSTGSEDIRFLDLTGLLNQDYSLLDLNRCLNRSYPIGAALGGIAELSIGSPKRKEKTHGEVAESWEDEDDEPTLPVQLNIPIFPNLTRLSLAHAGSWASWADLLAISSKLNTLTHLSLAYWPRPSTTPNAATTSMISKHTKPISLGGSHFYSDLDDDWAEAANILRRLSLNTYCLKWLDLEGCVWHKALTWQYTLAQPPAPAGLPPFDEWILENPSPGPDFTSSWRQIEYLNLYQGWIPAHRESLQGMPAGVVTMQVLKWLRENEMKEEVKGKLSKESGYVVHEWVEREKVARSVGDDILKQRRKTEGGLWCVVDHGWEKVVPEVRDKVPTPEV